MAIERVLDVSDLESPEPFKAVLGAVRELVPGHRLRVLHRREPFPLYEALNALGLVWRTRPGERSAFEILIWRRDDPGAEADCGPADDLPGGPLPRGCL